MKLLLLSVTLTLCASGALAKPSVPRLPLVATILMNGVEGRFDHFAFDPKTNRLFVSGLESRTIGVVDLKRRRVAGYIAPVFEPQGLCFVPGANRLLVASRGDGTLRSFDATTFKEGPWLDLGRNADNVRFDAASKTVYVGSNGEPGAGKLSAIDFKALLPRTQGGEVPEPRSPADLFPLYQPNAARQMNPKFELDLPSHPESMQLDPARSQLFVNVPDEHIVARVKIGANGFQITKRFPVPYKKNFPMAFDGASNRVFIASRIPPMLLAYNAATGEKQMEAPCVGDADDVYFDARAGRVIVIGGTPGAIDVFGFRDDSFALVSHTPTAPRARTGIYLPSLGLIVVAAPHTPGHRAQLRLYRARF